MVAKKTGSKAAKTSLSTGIDEWSEALNLKASAEGSVLDAWKDLTKILKDGKIEPTEVGAFLKALAVLLQEIGTLLGVLSVDARIGGLLALVGQILDKLSENLEKEIPTLQSAWDKIKSVIKDGEVTPSEIVPLAEGLSELLSSLSRVVSSYLDKETAKNITKLSERLAKLVSFFSKLSAPILGIKRPKILV